jgi:hypothetical protein
VARTLCNRKKPAKTAGLFHYHNRMMRTGCSQTAKDSISDGRTVPGHAPVNRGPNALSRIEKSVYKSTGHANK